MPELPEAQVVVDQLRRQILGARVVTWWLGRRDMVRQGLQKMEEIKGGRLTDVTRCGKSIVLQVEEANGQKFLVAELGMTGLIFFQQPHPGYHKHTHFIMTLEGEGERELRYWNARRFGRLSCFDEPDFLTYSRTRFGPDSLTVSWPNFRELIKGRRRRIKPLLMDQQVIAGIGNIYANEILYRARLHPNRISHRLSEPSIRRLYDEMSTILTQAVQDGGSSIRDFIAPNGAKGRYQTKHLVYGKAGEPCSFACGAMIRRLPGERSSFYCPSCQRR